MVLLVKALSYWEKNNNKIIIKKKKEEGQHSLKH
jgi:hypothetical protein